MWDAEMLEAHWLACMASAGGGGRVVRLGGVTVLTNPASPITMLNCLLLKGVRADRLEPLLEAGRLVLAAGEQPPALFLSPLSGDLPALRARLEALGWQRRLSQAVLVRPLDEPLPALSSEVAVAETADRESWGRLLVEAYGMPPPLGEPLRNAWTGLAGEARFYLAHLEGRPVGTGLSWRQGPVTGLYAGAVLPAWRRRGVERASLLRRMADARREGALLATLQTEAGSPVEHLARNRLGFTLAYERELWAPLKVADR
ncbi:MAG: GNAT family N-acetyltransferase [Bacillota bacterium]